MSSPTVVWEDLEVGDTMPPREDGPLTITDFVRYQGASGDMNPIHHDTAFAQASGFDQPFAVGMRQAGVLATCVTDWFGPANVRRFEVRWHSQAWPGDVLTYRGRITNVYQRDGERFADLELAGQRQAGDLHIEGWATVVVPG